jgi:hypothetical protein
MTAEGSVGTRLASLVIIAVLGLQTIGVLVRPGAMGWPFNDYPMYSSSHQEGERILVRYHVFATLADGREIEIEPEDLGVNHFFFKKFVRLLLRQDEDVAPALPAKKTWRLRSWLKGMAWSQPFQDRAEEDIVPILMDHYYQQGGAPIVRLRIEDTPLVITRDGMKEAEVKVLGVIDWPPKAAGDS